MSLIAWYPLNGDTKDYSGNNINGVNSGAKETTEGKIGKAYTFENDASGINITGENFNHLKEYTMSAWVKPKGNHKNYNGAIISSGNWNGQAWSFGLNQNNTSIDVASNRYNVYVSYTVPLNKWTHITSTMKNGIAKVYVNGEYITQRSATAQLQSDATNTFIGRETYAGGYFSFNGDLNDVRIYDHALSEKEAQEIAKAKILHYKFDDPYEEPTENLWNGNMNIYNNYNVPSSLVKTGEIYRGQDVYRLTMTVNDANSSRLANFQTSLSSHGVHGGRMTFKANTKYVASIYWKPISHSDTTFGGTASNISGWTANPHQEKRNGWKRYYATRNGTVTTDRTDNVFFSYAARSLKLNEPFIVDVVAPQIEEFKETPTPYIQKGREGLFYDSSGFNNHGTTSLTNTPQWINDSKVGKGAVNFKLNGLNSISLPTSVRHSRKESTYSVWYYNKNEGNSRKSIIRNYFEVVGNKLSYYSYGLSETYWRETGNVVPYNTWSHLSLTWDGEKIKLYVNGKLEYSQSKVCSGETEATTSIGGYSGRELTGLIDDVRIYATALSQKDILELYQSRANVDNKGNFKVVQINATTPKSAYEIKQRFPKAPSGLYLIKPKENEDAFYAYCDMETEGGGWTLLVTATNDARTGWNNTTILERNKDNPSLSEGYSILKYADNIKTNFNGELEYRLDAESLGRWGGVWRAPFSNTFTSKVVQRNARNVKQWDNWTLNTSTNSTSSPSANVMPWISPGHPLTTYSGANTWWGTIATASTGYRPAPWITPQKQQPNTIWYWVR